MKRTPPDTSRAAVELLLRKSQDNPLLAYHVRDVVRALLEEREALLSKIYNDAMFTSQRCGVAEGEALAHAAAQTWLRSMRQLEAAGSPTDRIYDTIEAALVAPREVCTLCCTKPATLSLCRSCAQPVIDGLEEPSGPPVQQ